MKPIPRPSRSQLSSVDPDLDLYQWQKLADYSDSRFSNFYPYAGSNQSLVSEFDSESPSSRNIMIILGVTATLLLIGSALWCRSVELNQPYPILEEAIEIENAPTVQQLIYFLITEFEIP